MRPIELPGLSPDAIEELANLFRTTHDVRLRTRTQMILLATDIAKIVRTDEHTVRRWLERYMVEA